MFKKVIFAILLSFIACLIITGCSADEKSQTEKDIAQKQERDERPDITVLQKAAEKEIASFAFTLKSSLKEAVRQYGAADALDICSEFAPEVAMAHSEEGWFVHRISDKSRNKNNEADSIQLSMLSMFISPETGPPSVSEWRSSEGMRIFYYYKPIYIAKVCLNCHGTSSNLAPGVAGKLKELYPEDEAINYKEGDLRGMFVVEIEWPRGKERAKRLAKDSL